MRIIAGTKRGMKLLSPTTGVSRPITDRVKESLFSVLNKYDLPEGRIVADLFSGVGSMGLESLSRGAKFASFVEKDPKVISVLEKNINKAGFAEISNIVRGNAFRVGAPAYYPACKKYDLVFVDPPYVLTKDTGLDSLLGELLTLLEKQITDDGIVVVRCRKQSELLDRYGRLEVIERRKWSSMAVTILGRKTDGE